MGEKYFFSSLKVNKKHGIFNINKIKQYSILLLTLFAFSLSSNAAINVIGDLASGLSIDIYAFEGTDGGTNPCSGTGSKDSNTNIGGDTTYDDDDDYTLSFTPSGSPVDLNVWFCDDATKLANITKGEVSDGTTITIDLGRVAGSSLHDDLDDAYVTVCKDFNSVQLSTEEIQVSAAGNSFTQYYAFQDDNSAFNSDLTYVFLDKASNNGCTWNSAKQTGREINTNSTHPYENHGVAADFSPNKKATGDIHTDLWSGTFRVWNTDENTNELSAGLLHLPADSNGLAYTLYYDGNAEGNGKLDILKRDDLLPSTFATHPDQNILAIKLNFTTLDLNRRINGDVPIHLEEIRIVNQPDGNVFSTSSLQGTPEDFNVYVPSGNDWNIFYLDNDASPTTIFTYDYDGPVSVDDTNKNLGVIRGEAHSLLRNSGDGADSVEVFVNTTCTINATQASSAGVQPTNNFLGTFDYNLYFYDDDNSNYYLQTTHNDGTSYTACGNSASLSNQIGIVDLNTSVTGSVDGNITTIGGDLQASGGDTVSDIDATVTSGTYYMFVGTGSDLNVAGQDDSNVVAYDSAGTAMLERNKDFANTPDANITFNVGHLEGEAHAELETGANDLFSVFSDTGCATPLSSSPGIGVDDAARDYNVFFEANATNPNDTNYYLHITDSNSTLFTTCGNRFTTTNLTNVSHNIDRQITGTVHSDITKVGVDWTTADGTDDANTAVFSSGRYWLFTNSALAGATDNVRFYRAPANTLVLARAKDVATADLNVSVAKVSGETHANLETGADDTIHVFSAFTASSGLLETQVSSVDIFPVAGTADDWNQYFEATLQGDGNYFLRTRMVDNSLTFDTNGIRFSAGASLATTVNITFDRNGTVVTDIARVGLDLNRDGLQESWTDVNNGLYNIFSTLDTAATSADLNYYKSSGGSVLNETINVTAAGTSTVGVSQLTGKLPQAFQSDTQFLDKTANYDTTCGSSDKNSYLAAEANGDYNLYYIADGSDYNALFCDSTTLNLTLKFTPDSVGGEIVTRNVAGVGGEAHFNLETPTPGVNSIVDVYSAANCTTQVSSVVVNPTADAANDYNVYFDANSSAGTYYLRTLQWGENASCQSFTGGTPTTFKTHNIDRELSGTVPQNVARIFVDSNGAYTTDFNTADSNRYYLYFGTESATTTTQALADSSTVLLSRAIDLTSDKNFHVGRVTGTSHADLNSTASDNLEIYSASTCAIGNRRSSIDINFPSGANFNQFFEANFDGNVYLKVINNNGSVDQNTCLDSGISDSNGITVSSNLNRRIQGIVGGDITRVMARFNTGISPDANVTPTQSYVPDAYTMYLPSSGDVNVLFFNGAGTLVLNKAMDTSSDVNVDVGYATGDVHANAIGGSNDTIEVFRDTGCSATITSTIATIADAGGSGVRDYNVYFDVNSLTTFYAKLVKDSGSGDFNTCLASGFTLTDANNTSVDFDRQIAGIVPDENSSNAIATKLLSVAVDIGDNGIVDINGDVNGDSYYLFADSDTATGDGNVIFFSDSGVTPELMKIKDISSDVNLHVNGVYGETHSALEGGSDTVEVCNNLPNSANLGSCTVISSKNLNPSSASGNDYELYYDVNNDVNSANETYYWMQIKDENSTKSDTFSSYHKITPVGNGGTVTDVNLIAQFAGTLVEDFNLDANISDVNVQIGTGSGSGSSANIAIGDLNVATFTDANGYFSTFTATVTPASDGDFLFEKNGYITESFDNNSDLTNRTDTNGAILIIPLSSGIEVQLKDSGGNLITDATVTILDDKNPDTILSGCTNPSGDCTRNANNASSGRYTFSGFTLPVSVAIKIVKSGFETIVDPVDAGVYYDLSTTANLDVNYTLSDSAPDAVSLISPSDAKILANTATITLEWADLNVDELDYNIQVSRNASFTSNIVTDTNSNGGNTLTYAQTVSGNIVGAITYYWRVRARDSTGWGSWSQTRSFTLDNNAPSAPTESNPSADVNSGESFTWRWNPSSDDNSSITLYEVKLYRNSTLHTDTNVGTALFYTATNLQDGSYDLNVRAIDSSGNWSAVSDFNNTVTVDTDLPGIISFTPVSNTDTNDTTPTYTVTADGQTVACKFTYTFNGTAYQSIAVPTASVCTFTVPTSLLSDTNTLQVDTWVQDQAGQDQNDWNGPFALPTYTIDTTAPTVTILTPVSGGNTSDVTPLIQFSVQDTTGTGIALGDINVSYNGNTMGFVPATHCTDVNNTGGKSYFCEFSSSTLTDPTNDGNLYVQVADNAANHGESSLTFTVDGNNFITVNSLIATKTTGVADNTYANGWQFDFNITLGLTDGNKVRFKADDWVSGVNTIDVNGENTRIMYDANIAGTKTTETYDVNNNYDLSIDVNRLWDTDTSTLNIDANILFQQRIPSITVAGQYSTKYFIRSYQ